MQLQIYLDILLQKVNNYLCSHIALHIVQPLPHAVLALQPPQFGTHYPLASVVLPLQTLSVASLKLTASNMPTAPPSGSAKCLRFGHWLTLCTLNMHVLTYLLTYLSGVVALKKPISNKSSRLQPLHL